MTTTKPRPSARDRELAAAKVSLATGVRPTVRFTNGAWYCLLRETFATPSYDTMASMLRHAGHTVEVVGLTRTVMVPL